MPAERAEAAAEEVPDNGATAAAIEPMPQSFIEVVALFDKRREPVLSSQLAAYLHLVHFEPGRIEFRPAEGAPRDLANRLGQLLGEWTGNRWLVAVSEDEGEPTLRQQREQREAALRSGVATHPLVRAVLETFPGATIAAVRERIAAAEPEAADGGESDANEADPDGADASGDI